MHDLVVFAIGRESRSAGLEDQRIELYLDVVQQIEVGTDLDPAFFELLSCDFIEELVEVAEMVEDVAVELGFGIQLTEDDLAEKDHPTILVVHQLTRVSEAVREMIQHVEDAGHHRLNCRRNILDLERKPEPRGMRGRLVLFLLQGCSCRRIDDPFALRLADFFFNLLKANYRHCAGIFSECLDKTVSGDDVVRQAGLCVSKEAVLLLTFSTSSGISVDRGVRDRSHAAITIGLDDVVDTADGASIHRQSDKDGVLVRRQHLVRQRRDEVQWRTAEIEDTALLHVGEIDVPRERMDLTRSIGVFQERLREIEGAPGDIDGSATCPVPGNFLVLLLRRAALDAEILDHRRKSSSDAFEACIEILLDVLDVAAGQTLHDLWVHRWDVSFQHAG